MSTKNDLSQIAAEKAGIDGSLFRTHPVFEEDRECSINLISKIGRYSQCHRLSCKRLGKEPVWMFGSIYSLNESGEASITRAGRLGDVI